MTAPCPTPIRVNGGRPQRGLVPSDTAEGYGARIVELLFAGLFDYDCDGLLRRVMAESVQTEDHRTFVIRLEEGWTFSDGTPVTSHSFVRAWSYVADPINRQAHRDTLSNVVGYDRMAGVDTGGQSLSGLEVVDALTFRVTLTEPDAGFVTRLGLLAFKPLPDRFFGDGPERFGRQPVGNGPYKVAAGTSADGEQLDLVVNTAYRGPTGAKNSGVTFRFYTSLETAYDDLLECRLDILDSIPESALPAYHRDLGDRAVDHPVALSKSLAIPYRLAHFDGEEGRLRRSALSMSIDRARIAGTVFRATKVPAVDFTCRALPGCQHDVAGAEVLRYDPGRARWLWERADRISRWAGEFTIAFNDDGGHGQWVDAALAQIHDALGVDVAPVRYPTFGDMRRRVADHTIMSSYRTGWRADCPSPVDFLRPRFTRGGYANEVGYVSEEFEEALAGATGAPDGSAVDAGVRRAQEVLLRDLPLIPLWDCINAGGHAPGIDVRFSWNGLPDYPNVVRVDRAV